MVMGARADIPTSFPPHNNSLHLAVQGSSLDTIGTITQEVFGVDKAAFNSQGYPAIALWMLRLKLSYLFSTPLSRQQRIPSTTYLQAAHRMGFDVLQKTRDGVRPEGVEDPSGRSSLGLLVCFCVHVHAHALFRHVRLAACV